MADERVVIEELVLRVPGLGADEARLLAADVAERVGRGLASAPPSRSLGALELKVSVPRGMDRARLAEHLAGAILRGVSG
ncbi:hypothetical protein [Myxococcus sp. RHSTA-1-4]|uniref:hypothetical protein n=1 Tax=Myxococcus sp. RHSTA-1-4 TaxID=2874601 RepID=UPI001CBDB73C|nr:hypothetical protein [Myxococcus sp. RHSTA-1-4]MBZ4420169.1 hypothetical protein [Myxococcus sp. RHSTA-1-4]